MPLLPKKQLPRNAMCRCLPEMWFNASSACTCGRNNSMSYCIVFLERYTVKIWQLVKFSSSLSCLFFVMEELKLSRGIVILTETVMEAITAATTDVGLAVQDILVLMIQIVATVEIVVTTLVEQIPAVCRIG